MIHTRPVINKLGTVECDLVEATPVVFHGKLYCFQYVRTTYKHNKTGDSYFRFVDPGTGKATPAFAKGYHLGSAFVDGDTVYAYGVKTWAGDGVYVFSSKDMQTWTSETAISLPGWEVFNTSVCKGRDGYVMAFEIGKPLEETGVPFTNRFATSDDLIHWKLTPSECVFAKDRYTACPAIRYLDDGYYYMIYLEALTGPSYKPYIVRSKDLIHWESSPMGLPVLDSGPEDKKIANPSLTPEERARIAGAVNINNSDVDLCDYKGKTIIYYAWGNQTGIEFLARAEYKGKMADFLKGWFPK